MTAKKSAPVDEVLEVVPTAEPETQELHVRNVYQRMIDAQRVIDSMPFIKDMANSQFKSIPIDQMRAAVRRACIEAGLVHVGPLDLRYEVQNRDGRIKVYTGECVFRYVNADDPSDFVDYPSLGEAMDTGDKGAGKLLSNLVKSHYKTCFDIGERGKDDIDSYANEDIMAEADRIAERRAKSVEKASADPFFGDSLSPLRKRIGAMLSKDGPGYVEGAEEVVSRYKAEHGQLPQWTKEVLERCVAECMGGAQ